MKRSFLVASLVFAGLVFFRLGDKGFWNKHSEARRAEIAREMAVSGQWLIPTLNGRPILTKPPLGYWLMALSFKATGRYDEWSARLPASILGLLALFFCALLGRELLDEKSGLLSLVILGTSPLFLFESRMAGIDMVVASFTTASFLFYVRMDKSQDNRSRWTNAFFLGISLGLASLTKGPVGLLPLAAIVGHLTLSKEWTAQKAWTLLAATGIACLLCVPWVLAALRVPGSLAVAHQETVGRWGGEIDNNEPWYFYLYSLIGMGPWFFFLVPAVFISLKKNPLRSGQGFLTIGLLAILVIESLVRQKKHYYLLPVYPLAALITAGFLADCFRSPSRLRKFFPEKAFWVLGGSLVSLYVIVFATLVPLLNQYRTNRVVLRTARESLTPSTTVVSYGYSGYDTSFYLERPVPNLGDAEIQGLLASGKPFVVLTPKDWLSDLERLTARHPGRLLTVSRPPRVRMPFSHPENHVLFLFEYNGGDPVLGRLSSDPETL